MAASASRSIQNKKRKRKAWTEDYEDPERCRLEEAMCLSASSSVNLQFLPHPQSMGVGKFQLPNKTHVQVLQELSRLIVAHVKGGGVTWGDVSDVNNRNEEDKDPRRRMYGFLHRDALLKSGIKIQQYDGEERGGGKEEEANDKESKQHSDALQNASVDLLFSAHYNNRKDSNITDQTTPGPSSDATSSSLNISNPVIYDALCSITRIVHRLVPRQYQQFATMDQLIAVQPNLHNGASYLPAHLDFPRLDGFGVILVTFAVRGSGVIVLVDEGDADEDDDDDDENNAESSSTTCVSFPLDPGESYILCGDARNKCVHGVLCEKTGEYCARETLNLRYGLHSAEFAFSEVDRHWSG